MGNWNDLNCKAKRRIVCELVTESNSFYDFIMPNYAEENLNSVIFDAYLRTLEKATSCPETPIEKVNERKCKYLCIFRPLRTAFFVFVRNTSDIYCGMTRVVFCSFLQVIVSDCIGRL